MRVDCLVFIFTEKKTVFDRKDCLFMRWEPGFFRNQCKCNPCEMEMYEYNNGKVEMY